MANKYAMVTSGQVTNIVLWDGNASSWQPSGDSNMIAISDGDPVGIGYTYDGTGFVSPDAPTAADLLLVAQSQKIADLYAGYQSSSQIAVSYTSVGGVTKKYQADSASQSTLLIATTGYSMAGATPDGFYWVSADNTLVPFTINDLKGLYGVMLTQGNVAFNKLQTLKASVRAATTVAAVSAISWESAQ